MHWLLWREIISKSWKLTFTFVGGFALAVTSGAFTFIRSHRVDAVSSGTHVWHRLALVHIWEEGRQQEKMVVFRNLTPCGGKQKRDLWILHHVLWPLAPVCATCSWINYFWLIGKLRPRTVVPAGAETGTEEYSELWKNVWLYWWGGGDDRFKQLVKCVD